MFPGFHFNETEILAFSLVFMRIVAFVVAWPVFSVYSVPNIAKILLALMIAIILFPVLDRSGLDAKALDGDIVWLVLREVFLGLVLGYITRLFFFAASVGGNLIATSVGLSNGQMFNPSLGATSTTLEQFFTVLATLFFLSANGHHLFLTGLAQSFDTVPLSVAGLNHGLFQESARFIHGITVAGLKIAAPVIVTIFLMNIAMGIIGRAVPQINVLITSLPVNILVGLGVMILMIPVLMLEMDEILRLMAEELFRMLKAF